MENNERTLVNIIGKIDDFNVFAKSIYLNQHIKELNALEVIESGNFIIPFNEENLEALLGMRDLKTDNLRDQIKEVEEKYNKLQNLYNNSLIIDNNLIKNLTIEPKRIIDETNEFIKMLEVKMDQFRTVEDQIKDIDKSIHFYSLLSDIKIPISKINDLKFFTYTLGSLTADNANRFKLIYEQIPSIIFRLENENEEEKYYLLFTENDFVEETDRVLSALDFKRTQGFNPEFTNSPDQIVNALESKKSFLEKDLIILESARNRDLEEVNAKAKRLVNELFLLKEALNIKSLMAFSDDYFYYSGETSTNDVELIDYFKSTAFSVFLEKFKEKRKEEKKKSWWKRIFK